MDVEISQSATQPEICVVKDGNSKSVKLGKTMNSLLNKDKNSLETKDESLHSKKIKLNEGHYVSKMKTCGLENKYGNLVNVERDELDKSDSEGFDADFFANDFFSGDEDNQECNENEKEDKKGKEDNNESLYADELHNEDFDSEKKEDTEMRNSESFSSSNNVSKQCSDVSSSVEVSGNCNLPDQLPPPPTSAKQQNSELIRRPLRERIIQLLAVKNYKKLEMNTRIIKEGCKEKNKRQVISCLMSVSNQNGNSYQLRTNFWREVKEDWSFYTDEDKAIVRQNKAQHVSPNTGGIKGQSHSCTITSSSTKEPSPREQTSRDSRLTGSCNLPGQPSPSPTSAKQQNSELIRRPLRERVIQLLAVKNYKKIEIHTRISKEGCKEKNKRQIISCLMSVSNQNGDGYQLRTNFWGEVKEDWSFYTDEEKAIVRQNKAQHVSLNTGRGKKQLPSCTIPSFPTKEPSPREQT